MEITINKKNELIKCLKCPVCQKLLCQPVTLFCQDTFCQSCLITRERQNNNHTCPTCKLQYFRPPIANFKLSELIDKLFPEEIKIRKEEIEKLPKPDEKETLKEEIIKSTWRDVINKKKSTNNGQVQLNADVFFLPINTQNLNNNLYN
jgi:hypothetical protein